MEGDAFGARDQPFLLPARIAVHGVSWCRALRLTVCACLEICPGLSVLRTAGFFGITSPNRRPTAFEPAGADGPPRCPCCNAADLRCGSCDYRFERAPCTSPSEEPLPGRSHFDGAGKWRARNAGARGIPKDLRGWVKCAACGTVNERCMSVCQVLAVGSLAAWGCVLDASCLHVSVSIALSLSRSLYTHMLTRTHTRKQICGEDTGCHMRESGPTQGDSDASAQRTDAEGTGAGPGGRAVADAVMMRHLRLLVDASHGTISGVRNLHACAVQVPLCPAPRIELSPRRRGGAVRGLLSLYHRRLTAARLASLFSPPGASAKRTRRTRSCSARADARSRTHSSLSTHVHTRTHTHTCTIHTQLCDAN